MIDEIDSAFNNTLQMFEDGIRKTPDEYWRQGSGDFLIPVRIAYHIMIGLEWFVTSLSEDEHRKTRRYNLNWEGPVNDLPDRKLMLDDLAWMNGQIVEWFADWERELAEDKNDAFRIEKALYFMRHTQHHVGEFSAIARLLDLEGPSWIYPETIPASIKDNA
jgi:hypothetical protein